MASYTKYGLIGLVGCFLSGMASAQDVDFLLVIKDHKFTPEVLEIPQGKKVKLVIDNQDATPEEFESATLNREKIIKGNSKGTVLIGPLKVGEYPFVGEFHEKTAKGKIVVK